MNERIKELILQSVTFRLDPDSECYEAQVCPEDLEGLAELIVRECIITIQMGITRDGPNTEKYLRSMKHIKQIKEHFGVAE
jgi:hypothetical protein